MKQSFIFLLLLFLFCCELKKNHKEVIYLVPHSPQDTASISHFANAYLITWQKDTLPFGCGSELVVISEDSTKTSPYAFQAIGAKLMLNDTDQRKFILEPHTNQVHVQVIQEGKVLLERDFVSPNLPYPMIRLRKNLTSYQIDFNQPNDRMQRIYPYDCRYGFKKVSILKADSSLLFETKLPSFQISERYKKEKLLVRVDSIYRLNYRNTVYNLSPSSVIIELKTE